MVNEFGLNERQLSFVDYYLKTGLIGESAKKAGYSPKSAAVKGSILLKNANVQKAIHARRQELKNERIAETQEIYEYLTSVMRGECEDEIAMNIGKGKGVTEAEKVRLKVSSKDRLKAAELLAKLQGMFINRNEVEFNGTIPIVICDDL